MSLAHHSQAKKWKKGGYSHEGNERSPGRLNLLIVVGSELSDAIVHVLAGEGEAEDWGRLETGEHRLGAVEVVHVDQVLAQNDHVDGNLLPLLDVFLRENGSGSPDGHLVSLLNHPRHIRGGSLSIRLSPASCSDFGELEWKARGKK